MRAGGTNVLPFTIWSPLIDTAHQVRIASPTLRETVVSTPVIPGLETTDALQHTTTYEYVGADLVKVTDPLGRITQRFYDAAGRMLNETDSAGQMTRFAYDKLNRVTQVTDALGGITTYGYDSSGRLGSVTDALNHTTTYGYDAFDRVTSRTDPLSKTETFTYDLSGNPSQRTDRKGQVTTRSYDALNRLHQITYADTPRSPIRTSRVIGSRHSRIR